MLEGLENDELSVVSVILRAWRESGNMANEMKVGCSAGVGGWRQEEGVLRFDSKITFTRCLPSLTRCVLGCPIWGVTRSSACHIVVTSQISVLAPILLTTVFQKTDPAKIQTITRVTRANCVPVRRYSSPCLAVLNFAVQDRRQVTSFHVKSLFLNVQR